MDEFWGGLEPISPKSPVYVPSTGFLPTGLIGVIGGLPLVKIPEHIDVETTANDGMTDAQRLHAIIKKDRSPARAVEAVNLIVQTRDPVDVFNNLISGSRNTHAQRELGAWKK